MASGASSVSFYVFFLFSSFTKLLLLFNSLVLQNYEMFSQEKPKKIWKPCGTNAQRVNETEKDWVVDRKKREKIEMEW